MRQVAISDHECTSRRDHVQKVYDAVAQEWHGTRYKAWPRVVDFVTSQPSMSLVADLGCGNGKMSPACRAAGHYAIGCDFSIELVRICALQLGMQAQAADVMALPYRSGIFDAALSIAVLHHISSVERRRLLVEETLRVLKPGGTALFYAWAKDQQSGRSGHVFPSPDVFVPFHQRIHVAKETSLPLADAVLEGACQSSADAKRPRDESESASSTAGLTAKFDTEKRAVVHQRYCHVYAEGELRSLVESVAGTVVLDEYYDTGNWCVVVEKTA